MAYGKKKNKTVSKNKKTKKNKTKVKTNKGY